MQLFKRENKKPEVKDILEQESELLQSSANSSHQFKREMNKKTREYLEESSSFHRSEIQRSKRSEKVAWRVVCLMGLISVLSVAAVCGLTPLKELVPYTIRVDNNSGFTDVVYPKNYGAEQTMAQVDDQYWLTSYVRAREGYNWFSVKSMYNVIRLQSSLNVFAQYKNTMLSDKSPVKLLKDNAQVEVTASPPVFINGAAQVRFTKRILDSEGKESTEIKPTHWVALITFDYSKKISTKADQLINPHGFQVLSYTKDQEFIGVNTPAAK